MAKVMIVDDSLFIRNRLVKKLTGRGYETVVAQDGQEAVDIYATANPDVVLMDITMPRKSGLQALREICQLDPQATVIMLTALDQEPIAAQAIQIGAKDFLVKPIQPERLIEALEKVLR